LPNGLGFKSSEKVMKQPPEIPINPFQLAILLNDEQKDFYSYVLAENVFCCNCGGSAIKGIEVKEIFLTNLNDVLVRGTCNECNGKVARIFEFGEDKAFYEKANRFRNSIVS
jgi:hypothetical protein